MSGTSSAKRLLGATITTTVNGAADLALTLAASPNPSYINNTVTYTLNVTNRGPNAASACSGPMRGDRMIGMPPTRDTARV